MKHYLGFCTCLVLIISFSSNAYPDKTEVLPQPTPFRGMPPPSLPHTPLPPLPPAPKLNESLISNGSVTPTPTKTPTPTPTPTLTATPTLAASPSPTPAANDSSTGSWLPWIIAGILALVVVFLLGRNSKDD
jgi:hypothetical protein